MALQITETRGMFSVHGVLNNSNASILSRHMLRFITPDRPVILNLERITKIDESAAFALQQLYVNAMRNNSILTILGIENPHIVPILRATQTSHILRNDHI